MKSRNGALAAALIALAVLFYAVSVVRMREAPLSCVACAQGSGNGWQEADCAGTCEAGARR